MKTWLALTVAVAALVVAGFVWRQNQALRESRDKYRREWSYVQMKYDELQREDEKRLVRDDVEKGFWKKQAREARGNQWMLLHESQIDHLRRAGLSDPVHQLRTDLMAHRELIPFKGVHGGTMGFYHAEHIALLDDRWVYAWFDDGHMPGSCLLAYEVLPDTTIHWTVIRARLW